MIDTVRSIVGDFGLLALLSLGVVAVQPLTESLDLRTLRVILLGVMFGVLASVVMLDPIPLPYGAVTDSRGGAAILAGVFGGPVAAVVANAIGAAVRYWVVGGPVALGGAVGFLLYGLAGLLAGLALRRLGRDPGPVTLAVIGAFGTALVLPSFFVSADWATGWAILAEAWPILLTANVVSTILIGLVLRFAEARAVRWAYQGRRALEADRLALAMEHATNGVLMADAAGRVTWSNPGFLRLTGASEAAVVGQPLPAVLAGFDSTEDKPDDGSDLSARLMTGAPFHGTLAWQTPDGRPYWATVDGQPVWEGGRLRHFVAVLTDITESKQLEQRLTRAEKVAHVGHWHLVTATRRVMWSDEVFRIFGLDPEGAGNPLDLAMSLACYHPEDRQRVSDLVVSSTETGEPFQFRARAAVGDETKWVDARGEAERDPSGRIVSLFGVVQDVTELARREIEAQQAREAADAANRSKSEFLATMSHELRTPLNAVIGFAEIIQGQHFGPLQGPSRYLEYAADIRDSGQVLLDLVNDVLDLSKIEAGRFDMNEETIAVAAVVGRAARLVRERAISHGLDLDVRDLGDAPPLRADERLFSQMLFNLMTNAVKFTPAGGRIALFAERLPDGELALVVEDNGVGIAPEDLARISEPYFQARPAGLRNGHQGGVGGTGLGLSLVTRMMDMHGGRLTLDSTPGEGTTARLVFPPDRVLDRD
ncbi:ATP-binding protein [Rhodospira trueperi]|uniref:histidine kinase n=1 Tax=Rhodospira trueperi TaxID=69960 RepID=A0A1G7CEG8_9PROT|nr:ATP-binding protein [Rhodospira trueperi]SDE36795.1 PAS domain S-box-containing protein [Rhodospira trueperi]